MNASEQSASNEDWPTPLLKPFLGLFLLPVRYEIVGAVALMNPILWPRRACLGVHASPFDFVFVTALSRNLLYLVEDLVVVFLGDELSGFSAGTKGFLLRCLVRCHDEDMPTDLFEDAIM